MCLLLLTVICLASGTLSKTVFSPCKVSDFTCVQKSVNDVLPQILDGIPELGVERSDPLLLEIIEANVPELNLTLFNSTIVGFKTCTISNLTFNDDITTVHGEASCKKFQTTGHYDMNGILLSLPITGKGEFVFTTGEYHMSVDLKIEKLKKNDGKTYVHIKDFKSIEVPLQPVKFSFKNMYNGQKDLAEAAHKFAEEKWKDILDYFKGMVWYPIIKKVVENFSKYFENVAVEDILLN